MGNRYNHPIERLEQQVERVTESGCWLWKGLITPAGYGYMNAFGKRQLTHRLMYEHYKGEISAGLFVCHRCDIPCCVNPDHMFLGDALANNRDSWRKGRGTTEKARAAMLKNRRDNPPAACPKGHPYDEKNTYISKTGARFCRACSNAMSTEKQRRRRARLKAAGLTSRGKPPCR